MSGPQKARRTQHFPDPRLEHQIDELVRAINAALDALDQMGVDIGNVLAEHVAATSGVHGVGESEVESKAGAQEKADAAQAGAKAYTDTAKAAVQANLDAHASDVTLHITDDYRGAMDASKVHPSATNPFVTEESLNDAMTGAAKPGVQTLADLAAVPPEERADKDTRLVENEGKIYRFDADADHGDVKPLEGQGYWIVVAAATQNHNNLSNLQGGSASERYHLTRAERDNLVGHLSNTSNPHQVTPQQIGAETQAGAQEKADAAEAAAKAYAEQQAAAAEAAAKGYTDAHANRKDNPHGVTPSQIGAETPSGAQAKVDAHASRTDNPHRVTAAQVGAYPAGSTVADSERLNGQPASYYTNIVARLGYTPVNRAGDTMTGALAVPSLVATVDIPSSSPPSEWPNGFCVGRVYDNGYPVTYGSVFSYKGTSRRSCVQVLVAWPGSDGGESALYIRAARDTGSDLFGPWRKVWTEHNDGSGSGLDADLLDGQHGSYYAKASDLDAHKASGDHDGRYYTKSQLNTSGGGGQVHWNNVTGKPSIPGSPVPVSQLKRAQGSFSQSVSGGDSFNVGVTVHQYAFASPSSYASVSSTVGATEAIGRFENDTSSVREWLFRAQRTASTGTATAYWTWDYLTASGHPRIWAEVDEDGEIIAMWEAEDPADPDFPDESPIQASRDADGNPLPGRLVIPLLMPDEWAISAVHDRLLTAPQGQWLTQSRFATLGEPVSIHRSMVDEQLRERALEIPDDIRAVFTDIKDYDRRHWYLQLWLRQASRLLYDHRPSTLIPLYRDMFRVDRRTGRLVLR